MRLYILIAALLSSPVTTSSSFLRHQEHLPPLASTDNTDIQTAKMLVDLKKNQLTEQINNQVKLNDRMDQIKEDSEELMSEVASAHTIEAQNIQNTNKELASAMLDSIANATNRSTDGDSWLLMKDGEQSESLMTNMIPTKPAKDAHEHWKKTSQDWDKALKIVHPKSIAEVEDVIGDDNNSTVDDYQFGQNPIAKSLLSGAMNITKHLDEINNAAGDDYLQTKRKTMGMEEEVKKHAEGILKSAVNTAKRKSLPPNIFDETLNVDDF
jgi:hypothetical protein